MSPADGAAALVSDEAGDGRRHLPLFDAVDDETEALDVDDGESVETQPTPKRRGARPRTLSMRRQSKRELERLRAKYPDEGQRLPTSRAECQGHDGPCPMVSCKHHLYLDVHPRTGNIKLNFPGLEVWEMAETCALDVADRGDHTLEEVGALVSLTRERVRQLEDIAFRDLRGGLILRELLGIETPSSRGEAAEHDDGSGSRSEREAVDGLSDVYLGAPILCVEETDGPTMPGDAW